MNSFDDKYEIMNIFSRSSVSSASSMSGRLKREYLGNKHERGFYSFLYSIMNISLKSKGTYLFILVEFLQFISLSFNKNVHTDSFSNGLQSFLQFFRQPFYLISRNYYADFSITTSITLILVLLCSFISLMLMINGTAPDFCIKLFDILYIVIFKLLNIPFTYTFLQFIICHSVNDTYYSLVLPNLRTFKGIGLFYFIVSILCLIFHLSFSLLVSMMWLHNDNGCLLSKLHGRFDLIADAMKLIIIIMYQLSPIIDMNAVFIVSFICGVILIGSLLWYLPYIRLFTNQLVYINIYLYIYRNV